MRKVIVYDFDKTLTNQDTLFAFFRFSEKREILFIFKLCIYFMAMILTKINIFSNDKLKNIGIGLFLSRASADHLNYKFTEFCNSNSFEFSMLYKNLVFEKGTEYYIVSASFEEYLKPMFPDFVHIVGSQLKVNYKGQLTLKFNCYGVGKVDALMNYGINNIDEFYTDSYDDLPLAKMAEKIVIVNKDSITTCKDINEFKLHFDK
jgi:2-hydroxy-3-keto-5-methylthiopentenyl-1-phosphate phosphatase